LLIYQNNAEFATIRFCSKSVYFYFSSDHINLSPESITIILFALQNVKCKLAHDSTSLLSLLLYAKATSV
jgi:hypothetical protein